MSPSEALERLISYIPVDSMRRKIGESVQKAPAEVKRALEKLSSADALNMRPYWK